MILYGQAHRGGRRIVRCVVLSGVLVLLLAASIGLFVRIALRGAPEIAPDKHDRAAITFIDRQFVIEGRYPTVEMLLANVPRRDLVDYWVAPDGTEFHYSRRLQSDRDVTINFKSDHRAWYGSSN